MLTRSRRTKAESKIENENAYELDLGDVMEEMKESSSSKSLKRQIETDVDDDSSETKSQRVFKCDDVFTSCLQDLDEPNDNLNQGRVILARSLSSRELNDEGWLSSPFMDIVFDRFAKCYPNVHFMSSDFAALSLSSRNAQRDYYSFVDILGNKITGCRSPTNARHTSAADSQTSVKDIVFVSNSNGIHWNLIRIQRYPNHELQLFEPMGKPTLRRGGLDSRSLPKGLTTWLDTCFPFEKPWLTVGISAITSQQQFTTYDCGVACLLYAEKCGLQKVLMKSSVHKSDVMMMFLQSKEDIDMNTDQSEITSYRTCLQTFLSSSRF